MATSRTSFWWMVGVPLLAATVGCIPDVNVTGIRGEGGAGAGASGTGGEAIVVGNDFTDPAEHLGGQDCITVECPPGLKVLSGGGTWDSGGLADQGLHIVPNASHPSATNEWELCGMSTPPDGYEWSAAVVCGSVDTQVVRVDATHPGTGPACIKAPCPAEMEAVGGGGQWTATADPPEIRWYSSRPTSDGEWEICGHSTSANSWSVEAVCAPVQTELAQSTPVEHGDNTSSCIEVTCPVGKVALGGGGEWSFDAGVAIEVQIPRVNSAGVNGWIMCAESGTVPPGDEWFVVAVCL